MQLFFYAPGPIQIFDPRASPQNDGKMKKPAPFTFQKNTRGSGSCRRPTQDFSSKMKGSKDEVEIDT
jgi:hypothetical protein